MLDRRFDREGDLLTRDEVLRLREYRSADGSRELRLGWKGSTTVTPEGYKARRELEYEIHEIAAPPEELLEALGFRESYRIDRYVEYYELARATARLEWYPRMDVLIEIEGDGEGIELVREVTGLPREQFNADSLTLFAARYAERTGQPALLALNPDTPDPPGWESR